MNSTKPHQNCRQHPTESHRVCDGSAEANTCERQCPLSCNVPSQPNDVSCKRVERPKRILMNKIYWCDCRPPLDKRECEICQKSLAGTEGAEGNGTESQ